MRYRTNYCIFNSTQVVDDSFCRSSDPQNPTPSGYEYCNTDECPQWSTNSWSACSAPCGKIGKRTRRVTCMFKSAEVDPSKCVSSMGRAPLDAEDCRMDCDGEWRTGEWSECSATCEKGLRSRNVYCERLKGQLEDYIKQRTIGMTNHESTCDPKKRPINVTECYVDDKCPKWIASSWSSCKGQCGQQGVRSRTVVCSVGNQRPNGCDDISKPSVYENCTVSCSRQWKADEWSEVSPNSQSSPD